MKHYFKKLPVFLYICIALFVYSCAEEKNVVDEQNRIKKVNLSDLPFLQRELNKETSKGSFARGDIAYYLDRIITENIIEIIDQQGLKSYTFALNFRERDTLFNLCAKETIDGYSYNLVKYSTTNLDQWIQDIKTTQQSSVMPEVEAERIDSNFILVLASCVEYNFVCPSGQHNILSEGSCEYELTSWTATYNIVPCYVASNVGGSGDNGGSGASGSESGTITMPNTVDEDSGTPCEGLNNLIKDNPNHTINPFKKALQDNANAVGQFGYEVGQKIRMTGSNYNELAINDVTDEYNSCNELDLGNLTLAFNFGFFHSHPTNCGKNGLGEMFSYGDIGVLCKMVKYHNYGNLTYPNGTPVNPNNFVITVASPYGTFAIKINDFEAFKNKANEILTSQEDWNDFSKVYSDGVPEDTESEFRKVLGLLKTLDTIFGNSLSVYKAQNNFTGWNKLVLNENKDNYNGNLPCNN